jgi:hypothetical protein
LNVPPKGGLAMTWMTEKCTECGKFKHPLFYMGKDGNKELKLVCIQCKEKLKQKGWEVID